MLRKTFTYEGKRYSVSAKTQEELYERVAAKKQALKTQAIKESDLTVKEWLFRWLGTFKEPYVSAGTYDMYATAVNVINGYIGHRRLKDIASSDIQGIITSEYRRGMSKSYIKKTLLTLNQAFERAVIDRKIIASPTAGIIMPKMKDGRNRALTDDERTALLAVAEKSQHGRWLRSMLYLGLRPSETAYIKGSDIDLQNRVIHVRGTKSVEADRYIPIPEAIINDYKGIEPHQWCFATLDGNPPSETKIKLWWRAVKREMDIYMGATVYRNQVIQSVLADDLRLYCLRHTFGTDCQAAGLDINVTRQLMGHSDISVTSKYYVHESEASRQNALSKLNKLHEQQSEKYTTRK